MVEFLLFFCFVVFVGLVVSGCCVFEIEWQVLDVVVDCLGEVFQQVCEVILVSRGWVVVIGMGKFGYIVCKIVVILVFIGILVFYVYFGEVGYGDLGMIIEVDVVLVLFYLGEFDEVLMLLLVFKCQGNLLIFMIGCLQLSLVIVVDIYLDVSVLVEVCLLVLVLIFSIIVLLVMGDVLVVVLFDVCGFIVDDFVCLYLVGSFGCCLLLYIIDVMYIGEDLFSVNVDVSFSEVLVEMSCKWFGMIVVVDVDGVLIGLFIDGDLCWVLDSVLDVCIVKIVDVMICNLCIIGVDQLVVEVVWQMEIQKINGLIVVDGQGCVVGVLNIYDLLWVWVV